MPPTRAPCLDEQWFVADNLDRPLPGMHRFGNSSEEALSTIYRLSRAIQVNHILAGRHHLARHTHNFTAIDLMDSIKALIEMAQDQLGHPDSQ